MKAGGLAWQFIGRIISVSTVKTQAKTLLVPAAPAIRQLHVGGLRGFTAFDSERRRAMEESQMNGLKKALPESCVVWHCGLPGCWDGAEWKRMASSVAHDLHSSCCADCCLSLVMPCAPGFELRTSGTPAAYEGNAGGCGRTRANDGRA